MSRFCAAQDEHFDLIFEGKAETSQELSTAYLYRFIDYIYENFDAFKLLVCRSDGTKYQDFLQRTGAPRGGAGGEYYRQLREVGKIGETPGREVRHMLTSAYFTAVFEVVAHDMPRRRPLLMWGRSRVFLMPGGTAWRSGNDFFGQKLAFANCMEKTYKPNI